jgi:hypothetical protein
MKKIFLLLTLIAFGINSQAQEVYSSSGKPLDEKNKSTLDEEEESGFNPNNMIYGGGLIFGIGGGVTNLGVSPVIGYRFSERLSAGVGLGYQYYAEKAPAYKFNTSIYSGSLWARLMLFQNIFLHVEPELNSLEVFTPKYDANTGIFTGLDKERKLVPSLLVGGGLRQPISDRVSFVGLILYDVLQDPNSPYNGIALRFGIAAGF